MTIADGQIATAEDVLAAISSAQSNAISACSPIVTNIAALRALTASTTATSVLISGYYTAGDGGGGLFVTGHFTSDNGGSIINDSVSRSWYRVGTTSTVRMFGAKGDGTTDDTTAFNAAFAVGGVIEIPAGRYLINQITVPSTVSGIVGTGNPILLPGSSVPSGSAANWITLNGLQKAVVRDIGITAPSSSWAHLTCLFLSGCTGTQIDHCTITGAGYTGISSALGNANKIMRNSITDWAGNGIVVAGSSSNNTDNRSEIAGNFCTGNGTSSVAHGISIQYAVDFDIHDNYCASCGTFGIGIYLANYGKVHDNNTNDTIHEGINVQDSSFVKVSDNMLRWTSGAGNPGTDFGISLYGAAASCIGLDCSHNVVVASAGCGICATGTGTFGVTQSVIKGNLVYNCNQKRSSVAGTVDNLAGILLSGTFSTLLSVNDNAVLDTLGVLTYGIAEYSFGNGAASSNEIVANKVWSSVGLLGQPVYRGNTFTTEAVNTPDLSGLNPWAPVVTSSTGTITTVTASGGYIQIGRNLIWQASVSVTNNGTGSGVLNITLPFAASASGMTPGVGMGVNATTNASLVVQISVSASTMQVALAGGGYPVASGQSLNLFGMLEIA